MPVLMQGTSSLANRLHCGFHYPRHEETARQCMRGFNRFQETFAAAILPGVLQRLFHCEPRLAHIAQQFLRVLPEDESGLPTNRTR